MNILFFLLKHWRPVVGALALVAAFSTGAWQGDRHGWSRGYAAGVASVPPPPACPVVKEDAHVEAPKCETKDPEIKIVYRKIQVPGPTPDCGTTVIVPDVTSSGGGSAASAGGATASVEVRPPEPNPDRPVAAPRPALPEPDYRWHAAGFFGVGGAGLEAGGSFVYRLLGPFGGGLYGRVPFHDPKYSSAGLVLDLRLP